MDAKKLERLNELENLFREKKSSTSNAKFNAWKRWSGLELYRELISLQGLQRSEQETAERAAHKDDWKNEPASQSQYNYLRALSVNLSGRTLTKGEASRIIDAVKSGNGVGMFGLEMYDGSN